MAKWEMKKKTLKTKRIVITNKKEVIILVFRLSIIKIARNRTIVRYSKG